jgi:hypothetical protein
MLRLTLFADAATKLGLLGLAVAWTVIAHRCIEHERDLETKPLPCVDFEPKPTKGKK